MAVNSAIPELHIADSRAHHSRLKEGITGAAAADLLVGSTEPSVNTLTQLL